MGDPKRGLYGKYQVSRTDGSDAPGGKHEGCQYFVLDCDCDKHAYPALLAYAASCEGEFPGLAADLRVLAQMMKIGPSQYFGKSKPAVVRDAVEPGVNGGVV